jgi:hypothetical protein
MMLLACNPCLASIVLFVLTQKVPKKSRQERLHPPEIIGTGCSCLTAMCIFGATVASALVILLLDAVSPVFCSQLLN